MTTNTNTNTNNELLKFNKKFSIELPKRDVGMFLGAKGMFLKKFIIAPTSREHDGSKVTFHLDDGDDEEHSVAEISAESDEVLKSLENNVLKHLEMTKKKILSKEKQAKDTEDGLSVFVVKTAMSHDLIPRYIGRGGGVIKGVQEQVSKIENCFRKEDTRVSITKERFVDKKKCFFTTMKGSDSDENVLITIKVFTKKRREAWDEIKPIVETSLEFNRDSNEDYLSNI